MKTAEQILDALDWNINRALLIEAMEEFARQSFDAAREQIKNDNFDPGLSDPEHMYIDKYKSFNDYFKHLNKWKR